MEILEILNQFQADRISVGPQMVLAASKKMEWYKPVMGGLQLQEEGGHSEVSLKNLNLLIEKLGLPKKVERYSNGGILVSWEDDRHYLATGFEVGYYGAGPYYFSLFGEKAGFGDREELYSAIVKMDREKTLGIIWQR